MKLFIILLLAAVQLSQCATPLEDLTKKVTDSVNNYLTIGPIVRTNINAFVTYGLEVLDTFLDGDTPNACFKDIITGLNAISPKVMADFERCQKPALVKSTKSTNELVGSVGGVLTELQLQSTTVGGSDVLSCAKNLQKVLAGVKEVPEKILESMTMILGELDTLLTVTAQCFGLAYDASTSQIAENFKGVKKCMV